LIISNAVAPIVHHLVDSACLPAVPDSFVAEYLRQGRLLPRGVLLELGINPGVLGPVSDVAIGVIRALLHSDIGDWV
jgi:hypothetical protein